MDSSRLLLFTSINFTIFFVEVEIKNSLNLQIINEYIQEFQRQYKQTEIQILIKDTNILIEMLETLPQKMPSNPNHLLKIERL